MKKLAKTLFMSLIAAAASSAIAGPSKWVSFSTEPGLKYGDGSDVLANEYVALCWSEDAEFGGIEVVNGKFTAAETGDQVICALPMVTKDVNGDSLVTPKVFLVEDKGAGYFFVFVLDTRVSATALAGSPSVVNGASEAISVAANSEVLGKDGVVGSTDYGAATYVTSTASLTITTDGEYPTVKAVGLSPILRYKVAYGDEPGKLESAFGSFRLYDGEDAATFVITNGGSAKFFQLQKAAE